MVPPRATSRDQRRSCSAATSPAPASRVRFHRLARLSHHGDKPENVANYAKSTATTCRTRHWSRSEEHPDGDGTVLTTLIYGRNMATRTVMRTQKVPAFRRRIDGNLLATGTSCPRQHAAHWNMLLSILAFGIEQRTSAPAMQVAASGPGRRAPVCLSSKRR
jgi:hypothetical protein